MVKSYLHFFLKLSFLCVLLIFADFIIGGILGHYYFKMAKGEKFSTTYSMEKTEAEILIFGSSRGTHHYVPQVFEQKLKLSCFNVGRDGNFIFYHYAILKSILKRYKPKMIILDIVDSEFIKDDQSYDRISNLLPYYDRHPEIHSIVELRGKYERLKLFSKIYPFNSLFLSILNGNIQEKQNILEYKGYVPLFRVNDNPLKESGEILKYELDTNKLNVYNSFIQECMTANVDLYIVSSPYFVKFRSRDFSIAKASSLAKQFGVKFMDLTNDSYFLSKPSLFSDPAHLNNDGSKIFSEIISSRILEDRIQISQ